ncbi:hypothetical protein D3C73_1168940 [compost metagenome]
MPHLGRKGLRRTGDLDVDVIHILPCCMFQGLRERTRLEAGGGEFVHQAAGVGEVAPEQIRCLAYVVMGGFGWP